jgi:hypothetical protein
MDAERGLTRREFDEVIRRATELAANEGESGELSVRELLRIAGDVGLPEHHVRRALAELRAGGDMGARGGIVDRWFGPEIVRVARVVPGSPSSLAGTLDEFLVAGQLLQSVRRGERILQYRPAVDWVSQVARAASSTSRRYYVASARSVEVRLDPTGEEDRTVVELDVDPGTRGDAVSGSVVGGLVGGGSVGAGVGLLLSMWVEPAFAFGVGTVAAAGCASAIGWRVGRSHRRKLGEVRSEVETILDQLEAGEGLEPPPTAWLRWVKRQFHGARRLLGDDDSPSETRIGSASE